MQLLQRSHVSATSDGYEAARSKFQTMQFFIPVFLAVSVSEGIAFMAGYKFVNGSDDEVSVADVSHALSFFFTCFPPVLVPILVSRLPLRCRVRYQRLSQRAQIQ